MRKTTALLVAAKQKSGGLPNAYTKLAYIESTGTQWIDTGLFPENGMDFEVTYYVTQKAFIDGMIVFGTRADTQFKNLYQFGIGWGWNAYSVGYGSGGDVSFHKIAMPIEVEKKITVKFDSLLKTVYINEKSFDLYLNGNFTDPIYVIYLFCRNDFGNVGTNFLAGRIYNCKFTKSGKDVRNFVPVIRKADNIVGMYDTVTKTFFTNQGTGEFIAGYEEVIE